MRSFLGGRHLEGPQRMAPVYCPSFFSFSFLSLFPFSSLYMFFFLLPSLSLFLLLPPRPPSVPRNTRPHGECEGALHLPGELWCPATELPTREPGTGATGRGGCRYCHHMVTWGVAILYGRQSQPMWWCTLSVPVLPPATCPPRSATPGSPEC